MQFKAGNSILLRITIIFVYLSILKSRANQTQRRVVSSRTAATDYVPAEYFIDWSINNTQNEKGQGLPVSNAAAAHNQDTRKMVIPPVDKVSDVLTFFTEHPPFRESLTSSKSANYNNDAYFKNIQSCTPLIPMGTRKEIEPQGHKLTEDLKMRRGLALDEEKGMEVATDSITFVDAAKEASRRDEKNELAEKIKKLRELASNGKASKEVATGSVDMSKDNEARQRKLAEMILLREHELSREKSKGVDIGLVNMDMPKEKDPRQKLTEELKKLREFALNEDKGTEVTTVAFSDFIASAFNRQKLLGGLVTIDFKATRRTVKTTTPAIYLKKEMTTPRLMLLNNKVMTTSHPTTFNNSEMSTPQPILKKVNYRPMNTVPLAVLLSSELMTLKNKQATHKLIDRKTTARTTTSKIATLSTVNLKYIGLIPHFYETTQKPESTKIDTQAGVNRAVENTEITTEPFSIFLKKIFYILAGKSVDDLSLLLEQFKHYVHALLIGGQLAKLGMETNSYISRLILILDHIAIGDIRLYCNDFRIALEDRQNQLAKDINDLLDYADDMYVRDEEEAMQAILYELHKYPNTTNKDKVAQGFVDYVFLKPMLRITGGLRGNILFKMLAEVVKKRYKVGNDERWKTI